MARFAPGSPGDHADDRRDLRICRMLDHGMSRGEVAGSIGMSVGHVARLHRELQALDGAQLGRRQTAKRGGTR